MARLFIGTLLAFGLGLGAAVAQAEAQPAQEATLYDLVRQDPQLSLLAEAIALTGLADELAAEGPYTLLAPSDEALAALLEWETLQADPAALAQLLRQHLLVGAYPLSELIGLWTVLTFEGETLSVLATDEGSVAIGEATVIEADREAANGVLHVVDTVLLPAGLTLEPTPDNNTDEQDDETEDGEAGG